MKIACAGPPEKGVSWHFQREISAGRRYFCKIFLSFPKLPAPGAGRQLFFAGDLKFGRLEPESGKRDLKDEKDLRNWRNVEAPAF